MMLTAKVGMAVPPVGLTTNYTCRLQSIQHPLDLPFDDRQPAAQRYTTGSEYASQLPGSSVYWNESCCVETN